MESQIRTDFDDPMPQEDLDAQERRTQAIVGNTRSPTKRTRIYCEYLRAHLEQPCHVTGIEDFRWEEIYVFGPGDKMEYRRLKKTQPSYTDTFELVELSNKETSRWMLSSEDVAARVRRLSNDNVFWLGLSELKATDDKSSNYQLLDDYSVWFINYR